MVKRAAGRADETVSGREEGVVRLWRRRNDPPGTSVLVTASSYVWVWSAQRALFLVGLAGMVLVAGGLSGWAVGLAAANVAAGGVLMVRDARCGVSVTDDEVVVWSGSRPSSVIDRARLVADDVVKLEARPSPWNGVLPGYVCAIRTSGAEPVRIRGTWSSARRCDVHLDHLRRVLPAPRREEGG